MFLEASFGLRLFWGSDTGVYDIFTEGMPPKNVLGKCDGPSHLYTPKIFGFGRISVESIG